MHSVTSAVKTTGQVDEAAQSAAQAVSASVSHSNYTSINNFLASTVQAGDTINAVNYDGAAFLTNTATQRVTDTNKIHIYYVIDVSLSDINNLFNTQSQDSRVTISLHENTEKTSTAIEIECKIDNPTDDIGVYHIMSTANNFFNNLFYSSLAPNNKHNFYVQCPSGSNIYCCLPFFVEIRAPTTDSLFITALNEKLQPINCYVNGNYRTSTPNL
jgi:hypothetical protein